MAFAIASYDEPQMNSHFRRRSSASRFYLAGGLFEKGRIL